MALDCVAKFNRLEQDVLRVLCQGTAEGPVRELARAALQHYQWREPVHQAIFEALLAVPCESSETIRAELPARLTRMGFPDVDWEKLFEGSLLSRPEGEDLVRRLGRER
ncbi:MAG: hypothetical protein ACRD3O_17195 [Terriglobia bacterium]